MVKAQTKLARTYCGRIRTALPISGSEKKNILNALTLRVDDYIADHPDATLDTIQAEFGTPEEICASFWEETPRSALSKRFRLLRGALITLVCVMIVGFLGLAGVIWRLSKSNAAYVDYIQHSGYTVVSTTDGNGNTAINSITDEKTGITIIFPKGNTLGNILDEIAENGG